MNEDILLKLEERQERLQREVEDLEAEMRALKGQASQSFQATESYRLEQAPAAVANPESGNRLRKSLASRRGFLKLAAVASVMGGAAFVGRRMAQADVPTTINYQGRLTDNNSNPLTGSYNMTFALYEALTGGTALWTETRSGANAVPVNNGLFNALLGSLSPIPQSVLTKSNLYLGITVGSDPEMTPRQPLSSVPFALQVADGSVSTAKLADGAVTSRKLQRTRYLAQLSQALAMNKDQWYDLVTQTVTLEVASVVTVLGQVTMQTNVADTSLAARIVVDASRAICITDGFMKSGVATSRSLAAVLQLTAGSYGVQLQGLIRTYPGDAFGLSGGGEQGWTNLQILVG